MRHRMDPDLTIVQIEHLERVPGIRNKNYPDRLCDWIFHAAKARHRTEAEYRWVIHPVTQKRHEDKQRHESDEYQPDDRVSPSLRGFLMYPINEKCRNDHKRHDPKWTVAMQTDSQK